LGAEAAALPAETRFADYGQLRELTPLAKAASPKRPLYADAILSDLRENAAPNVAILGPDFIGKRTALREFARTLLEDFPPLVFSFGSGGTGLCCIADALVSPLRDLIGPKTLAILDEMAAFIFKERLEDEFSPFAAQKAGLFLRTLLESYFAAAQGREKSPVVLLENIHLANPAAARVFIDAYAGLVSPAEADPGPYLYGTSALDFAAAGEAEAALSLGLWNALFPRTLRVSPKSPLSSQGLQISADLELPQDLMEIAYAAALFRQYFPASLRLRLFAEEGKNPAMVSRALDMLAALGGAAAAEESRAGEARLGVGTAPVQTMVRNRLLSWVGAGKLRPGFNLLRALADLGMTGSGELVLEALRRDLINGTGGNLRKAIEESRLADFTGPAHIPALLYMQRTLESLLRGDEASIAAAFRDPPPEDESPPYKARLLAHAAAHSLGLRDTNRAAELVKDAMLISQGRPGGGELAQAHRLFALVNLSKGRIADAIDYMAFAMDQAEKSGDLGELAPAAYYAASLQFLQGNISKAERLAAKAEEIALSAGLPAWADRTRFLRGKLLFEQGRYKESLELFGALRRGPAGALPPAAEDTLEAWMYRAAVLQGTPSLPKPQRPNTDARIFEIEASYLSGDYRSTVELSERLLGELPDSEYLFTEQPDWRSGFSQGELLLFSPGEFLAPLVSAYRALGLSRLGKPTLDKAGRDEARRIMEGIIQDERFSDQDPNAAFYFFAYYRILGESGAAAVDMDTAVSMAYKRLQRRASRMDDAETNRAFLTRHYWNGALSRAAKEHKLI
jgi:tetratricopeptide (TPR) repeat protein